MRILETVHDEDQIISLERRRFNYSSKNLLEEDDYFGIPQEEVKTPNPQNANRMTLKHMSISF